MEIIKDKKDKSDKENVLKLKKNKMEGSRDKTDTIDDANY